MYDNRKYVELNENGIVKRIHDIQAELILEGLQSRGLTKSLDAMKTLSTIGSSYGQGYPLEHLRKYMDAIELDIMH